MCLYSRSVGSHPPSGRVFQLPEAKFSVLVPLVGRGRARPQWFGPRQMGPLVPILQGRAEQESESAWEMRWEIGGSQPSIYSLNLSLYFFRGHQSMGINL